MRQACVAISILFLLLFSGSGHCAEGGEEALVQDFYRIYIKAALEDKGMLDDAVMRKYVSPCTVAALRIRYERESLDADYFLKAQDVWDAWLTELKVHDKIVIHDAVSAVPVTFGNIAELLVFVEREGKSLFITKVEDLRQ